MFELEPGLIFWNTVSFAILVFLLYKWVLPPLLAILKEREKAIAESFLKVDARQKEAEAVLAEVKQKLSAAGQTAQEMVDQAKLEGEKLKSDLVGAARSEAERLTLRAKEDLRREKNEIIAEVEEHTADLVAAATASVLRKKIDKVEDKRLIEESLKECQR